MILFLLGSAPPATGLDTFLDPDDQRSLIMAGACLTFELQALHGDLFDVGCGTQVKLPDFDINAQMSHMKDQKRGFLLLPELLQGQRGLWEEPRWLSQVKPQTQFGKNNESTHLFDFKVQKDEDGVLSVVSIGGSRQLLRSCCLRRRFRKLRPVCGCSQQG